MQKMPSKQTFHCGQTAVRSLIAIKLLGPKEACYINIVHKAKYSLFQYCLLFSVWDNFHINCTFLAADKILSLAVRQPWKHSGIPFFFCCDIFCHLAFLVYLFIAVCINMIFNIYFSEEYLYKKSNVFVLGIKYML